MTRLLQILVMAAFLCPRIGGQVNQKSASFALQAGKQYENLGEWEKAEEQFLKAGSESPPNAQQEALEGVQRARKKIIEEKRKLFGKQWPGVFDEFVADAGRILLAASALLIIGGLVMGVNRARRSMQFLPFQASSDAASKQIAFWLGLVRAELRNPAAGLALSPSLTSSLPFVSITMPGLPEPLTESLELEIGGVKLPLKLLTQLIAVPRVRISGMWTASTISGMAYSEIERRGKMEFSLETLISIEIDPVAGWSQDRDLRLFAYDVVMKAGMAYGRN